MVVNTLNFLFLKRFTPSAKLLLADKRVDFTASIQRLYLEFLLSSQSKICGTLSLLYMKELFIDHECIRNFFGKLYKKL